MVHRLRAHLTYANVVATLALFVAVGGTSYAALRITSRDIKNRSIHRVDIKKNALTGVEIKESKLGTVPKARSAGSAGSALTAGSAGSASSADVAKNASALGGQTAQDFEKSTRTQFGRASAGPADQASEQTLLSWPAFGAELRTSSTACGGGAVAFAVRNTKSSGSIGVLEEDAGFQGSVPANSLVRRCSGDAGTGGSQLQGQLTDSSGRALFFDCLVSDGELRCLGTRSEP